MEFGKFIREVYLRSVPSVDLDNVTGDQKVNCSDHKLTTTEYDKILQEHGVKQDSDEMTACNLFMLQSGPQLVEA